MSGGSGAPQQGGMLSGLVGERLRFVREKMGLSQRELARRAQVTNGTLSNIEQGRVSPSVASLEKILTAIPMSMQEFFSEDLEVSPSIYRREHFVHIHKNDTDYFIMPLSEGQQSGAYLASQSYSPGARVSSEWMVHDGIIAGMVVAGTLELILEGVEYLLHEGDGFNFSLRRAHSFRNSSSEHVCRVVSVSFPE